METEALIEAVEKRKCLYDKADENYSNRNFTSAEWKKVANEVGCSENEARKQWKQLRDYFLKMSREPQKSGSAGGVKRKWYLHDRMLFIKAYTGVRQTSTNMEPLSLDDNTANNADLAPQNSPSSFSLEASESRAPTPSNGSTAEAEIIQDVMTQDESSATNRRNVNKRPKKSFPQQQASQSAFETEMIEAAKRLGHRKELEISEEEHYFKNLVPKLQQMSPLDRMECQGEIHMIVLKYMKKSLSSTFCGARRSDRDLPPSGSSETNCYVSQPYEEYTRSQVPLAETSHSVARYDFDRMSQYRQYPDC
ncbi:transcription factor adf-1 [Plakobranchus ocellatus]|uniref:Transcription factor adf-1 n=1 Tax=Plakobranchus ocellatus TaxID=259542 RepID=A0AAV3YWW2_9GAST|nr:transcription factor adf-1 [Plakobranchus ocellatus]